jgi:hypothetical protein
MEWRKSVLDTYSQHPIPAAIKSLEGIFVCLPLDEIEFPAKNYLFPLRYLPIFIEADEDCIFSDWVLTIKRYYRELFTTFLKL